MSVKSHRPFRFGVQGYVTESASAWRTAVRDAEAIGFSIFSVADHYFGPGSVANESGHPAQNIAAIPAMAVAAEATSQIRIGSRVLCVDYHRPAVLVKEAATLDFLSDGRFELGLGAGWIRSEYEAMGIRFDPALKRIERLVDVVQLARHHFAGEQIDLAGEHVRVTGYCGTPAPVQKPRLPILVGGGGRHMLTTAGRIADIVSINFNNRREKLDRAGVGESGASQTLEKIGWIKEGAGDRFDELELELAVSMPFITNRAREVAGRLGDSLGLSADEVLDHPHALIGTVDEICNRLIERREMYGINYVTVSVKPRAEGSAGFRDLAPIVEQLSGK